VTAPYPPPTGARADLVDLARILAEDGVPAEVILDDARAGIAEAVRRRSRSGR
jgi:hypothetical protein